LEVDYLNENYKLSLPEQEHYETLGGMIVSFTQGIPQAGETVVIGKYQIEIMEVSTTKIDLVCIKTSNPDT
ncbi:MAG TPA: hemolysin, partial [Flavobacteriaceae bacterium]|nr:hemolysin [Flavobacteriaceae bacterium]